MICKSPFDLFVQALNITNASLEANRNSVVLKPLLARCRTELRDEDLNVTIFDESSAEPLDWFTIRLRGEVFVLASHGAESPVEADHSWNVSVQYLQDVIQHPRKYIQNPSLLDLEWLRHRLTQHV